MVKIRKVDNLERALNVVRAVAVSHEPVAVDFDELGFMTPGAALLISSALRRRLLSAHIDDRASGFGYAAHIGFFDACGLDGVGKAMGEASGGRSYAPIRALACNDVRANANKQRLSIAQSMQIPAENLARVLSQSGAGPMNVAVTFAMREVMRNAVEHSGADHLWYSGQYWESTQMVEAAVLDEGIGLRSSLLHNPENGEIDDEFAAIRMAMRPGVSEVPEARRGGSDDNSGFGLYLVRRLCLRGKGSFSVVSNDAAIQELVTNEASLQGTFTGTLLQLRLDVSALGDVGALIDTLVFEGESELEDRGPGASHSSKTARV